VLDKICRLDLRNIEHIEQMRRALWPRAKKEEEEERARQLDREERRRKARERQQRLMAEFASKQRQFLEKSKETGEPSS
jgi:E3 ubiquitin-protein ligase UBR3